MCKGLPAHNAYICLFIFMIIHNLYCFIFGLPKGLSPLGKPCVYCLKLRHQIYCLTRRKAYGVRIARLQGSIAALVVKLLSNVTVIDCVVSLLLPFFSFGSMVFITIYI